MKTKVLGVRLPIHDYQALVDRARRLNMPLSDYVRSLLCSQPDPELAWLSRIEPVLGISYGKWRWLMSHSKSSADLILMMKPYLQFKLELGEDGMMTIELGGMVKRVPLMVSKLATVKRLIEVVGEMMAEALTTDMGDIKMEV